MNSVKSAVVQFALWLIVSGTLVVFVVWHYHYGERFETAIVYQKKIPDVDRVWFNESNALFAAARSAGTIEVRQITDERSKAVADDIANRVVTIRAGVPYAVSPAGDAVVSALRSTMTVNSLAGDPVLRHEAARKTDVTHVAWIDGSVILALHSGGMLEALDAGTLVARAEIDTQLEHPTFLDARGTFFAAASPEQKRIRLFDTRMIPQISSLPDQSVARGFTCLAVSSSGRVAVCTEAGPVLDGMLLGGVKKPRLIEFYQEQGLLVTTETGMMFLGDPAAPFPVPNVPARVRSVALADANLAVASADGVTLLSYRLTPPIRETGWWIIWRWLGATAILAMFFIVRSLFLRAGPDAGNTPEEDLADVAGPV